MSEERIINKLVLEIHPTLKREDDKAIDIGEGSGVIFTPSIDEKYWMYRVKLFKEQSMLGFPKFFQIGIGFAQEEDWNHNLPSGCETKHIYNHIKRNKKYDEITEEQCIRAIEMIKEAVSKMEVEI